MILVAGGTGTLGRPLVRALAAEPGGLRVLTRDGAHAAELRAAGIEPVIGDVRDAAARDAAVAGCDTVVAAVHGFTGPRGAGPAEIDRDATTALIGAAVAAGVERFVLVSAYGAAPDHAMSLHRMKHAAEQALMRSGLRWSIVRPTSYLETWLGIIGARLDERHSVMVFGKGENPINFVSVQDVVEAILNAVHGDADERIVDVTGPADLGLAEIASTLAARSSPPVRVAHVPLGMLRAMAVLARPISPAFARQAQAAVLMNTTDMTVAPKSARQHATTIDEVLDRRGDGRVADPRS